MFTDVMFISQHTRVSSGSSDCIQKTLKTLKIFYIYHHASFFISVEHSIGGAGCTDPVPFTNQLLFSHGSKQSHANTARLCQPPNIKLTFKTVTVKVWLIYISWSRCKVHVYKEWLTSFCKLQCLPANKRLCDANINSSNKMHGVILRKSPTLLIISWTCSSRKNTDFKCGLSQPRISAPQLTMRSAEGMVLLNIHFWGKRQSEWNYLY